MAQTCRFNFPVGVMTDGQGLKRDQITTPTGKFDADFYFLPFSSISWIFYLCWEGIQTREMRSSISVGEWTPNFPE